LLPPGAGPISATYAFLLYSIGPDGLMGTADDGALAVSLDEVKAAMPTLPPAAQPDATNDRPAQYCP
ncbi:MAG: hypothetical protein KGI67_13805, partial [Pseudomonadota bacterium]|nr:hypothetical protein [Pseudomonadota bacterium]